MSYEVFERTVFRVEEPALSLMPDGRIALNAAAARLLQDAAVKFALLLYDKTHRKIALKATTKGDTNAYAVSMTRGSHSGSLRAKAFLSYIGWFPTKRTTLPATWYEKDKMLEVTLPKG